jgi:hypothetical protein
LIATVQPANATNKNVTWHSSSSAIATVDNNGLVTANAEGTADITVKTEDGNFITKCEVRCIIQTPPTLSTLNASNIIGGDAPSAKLGGNVTFVGNPPYIERGVVFVLYPEDPMDPNPDIPYWAPGIIEVTIPGNGIGIFSQDIQFSVPSYVISSYNIRAYVKTSVGTTYGDIITVSF